MKLKQKQEIVDKWIKNHGAAGFDLTKKDILLYDGGLFSIEKKKVMLPRIIGYKKITTGEHKGCSQVLFSKKKYPNTEHYALMWFEELDDTISYFQSMRRMLNKMGYNTGKSKEAIAKLKKRLESNA